MYELISDRGAIPGSKILTVTVAAPGNANMRGSCAPQQHPSCPLVGQFNPTKQSSWKVLGENLSVLNKR